MGRSCRIERILHYNRVAVFRSLYYEITDRVGINCHGRVGHTCLDFVSSLTAREIYACTCSNELNKKTSIMPIDTYDQTERKRWSSFTYMRVWLYDLAIITFAVMIEEFVHLCIAQSQAPLELHFGLFLRRHTFCKRVPILTTYISWHEIYNENYTRHFKHVYRRHFWPSWLHSVTLFVFRCISERASFYRQLSYYRSNFGSS